MDYIEMAISTFIDSGHLEQRAYLFLVSLMVGKEDSINVLG
jgi:hypothetical protein